MQGPLPWRPRSAGRGRTALPTGSAATSLSRTSHAGNSIASLPATSLPLFATVRIELTVDRYQPENPEPFSGRARSYRGRRRLFSILARVHSNAHLLWTAGRGLALLLVNWISAASPRIYVGAVLSALSVAIGGNAILRQVERHSSPLFAPANHQVSPASENAALAAKTATTDPSLPSAALVSGKVEASAPALSAASPAALAVPHAPSTNSSSASPPIPAETQASALNTASPATSAVANVLRPKSSSASPPKRLGALPSSERRSVARTHDQIGDLLRGKLSGADLVQAAARTP